MIHYGQRLIWIGGLWKGKYRETLNKIIMKIKDKVRLMVDKALERIKICMKSGNELYSDDMSQMQEAHLF